MIEDFAVPAVNRVKIKENEKRKNYLDLAREQKKVWNIVFNALGTILKGKRGRRVGNQRTSKEHPNCRIFKIDQNTEKSPGDF